LAACLAACGGDDDDETANGGPNEPIPTPEGQTPTPEGQTPTPFVDVCQPNPDPGTPEKVRIDAPAQAEAVSNPIAISGSINGPESRFRIGIFDPTGRAITLLNLDKTPDTPREFSENIEWDVVEPTAACVRVFELTPETLPANVAQVGVFLGP
jgi:hypothetical protein